MTRDLGDGCRLLLCSDVRGRLVGACGWGPASRLAKEFKVARTLVERASVIDPTVLRDPATRLRSLLQGPAAPMPATGQPALAAA